MAIPDPEPGLVVHFNYLWSNEFDRGREEARYPRPCAIVLSYRRTADGATIAMLAPITPVSYTHLTLPTIYSV